MFYSLSRLCPRGLAVTELWENKSGILFTLVFFYLTLESFWVHRLKKKETILNVYIFIYSCCWRKRQKWGRLFSKGKLLFTPALAIIMEKGTCLTSYSRSSWKHSFPVKGDGLLMRQLEVLRAWKGWASVCHCTCVKRLLLGKLDEVFARRQGGLPNVLSWLSPFTLAPYFLLPHTHSWPQR